MLLAGAGIGDGDFQIELALGLGFTRLGLILVFDNRGRFIDVRSRWCSSQAFPRVGTGRNGSIRHHANRRSRAKAADPGHCHSKAGEGI